MTIDGITIKRRDICSERIRDNVRVPHEIKEVEFNPPADLEFLKKHDDLAEDIEGGGIKLLS